MKNIKLLLCFIIFAVLLTGCSNKSNDVSKNANNEINITNAEVQSDQENEVAIVTTQTSNESIKAITTSNTVTTSAVSDLSKEEITTQITEPNASLITTPTLVTTTAPVVTSTPITTSTLATTKTPVVTTTTAPVTTKVEKTTTTTKKPNEPMRQIDKPYNNFINLSPYCYYEPEYDMDTCDQEIWDEAVKRFAEKGYVLIDSNYARFDACKVLERDGFKVYEIYVVNFETWEPTTKDGYAADYGTGIYSHKSKNYNDYGNGWVSYDSVKNGYEMYYIDSIFGVAHGNIHTVGPVTPWQNGGSLVSEDTYVETLYSLMIGNGHDTLSKSDFDKYVKTFYRAYKAKQYYQQNRSLPEATYILNSIDNCNFSTAF